MPTPTDELTLLDKLNTKLNKIFEEIFNKNFASYVVRKNIQNPWKIVVISNIHDKPHKIKTYKEKIVNKELVKKFVKNWYEEKYE